MTFGIMAVRMNTSRRLYSPTRLFIMERYDSDLP